MARDEVERKLAAILAADVVGYSRLMGADEEGTLKALKRHRAEVIEPKVAEHHGRVVKTTGDGILVEFMSVVDAMRCAVEVQGAMAERNHDVPEERRIVFRLGVNLGDVIADEGDIYGDGVNVAARLEGLAEPGGICISRAVRDQVRDKMPLALEDLGEQNVKNIARPVRAFRVVLAPEPRAGAAAALELPDKPSIAVLPFANMSGDPEQEYFADGISEDIITELSRFNSLFVIARNSSFAYKGRNVKVQEVARDLGVKYVVEGSVRKAGNRVRVTAQLIEAATGNHLWAERYDRELEDIFAVQDEVTRTVVATLAGWLEAADMERAKRKPTERLDAYDYLLRGKVLHHRFTKEANAEGARMLEKAVELDPEFAEAHAWLACIIGQGWARGWAEKDANALARAEEAVKTAYALDENDIECNRILCEVYLLQRDYERAMHFQERALALNPNDPRIVVQRGYLLTYRGRPEEGAEWLQKAMRLDPYHWERYWYYLGLSHYMARRYGEAVVALKRITASQVAHRAVLAAACAQLGEVAEAKAQAAATLEAEPGFTGAAQVESASFEPQSDKDHLREGLIAAGLPA
ncbi:MAG: adenylate/guanylate cyclase domain-containing protein [Alphaproteobacteria bacterium]